MCSFEVGDIVRVLGPRDKESLVFESEAAAVGLIGKVVGTYHNLIYVEFDVYNECWEQDLNEEDGYNSGFVYYFFPDEIELCFENKSFNICRDDLLSLI